MESKIIREGYYLGPIRSDRYVFRDAALMTGPYGAHRKQTHKVTRIVSSPIIKDLKGNPVEVLSERV